MNKLLDKNVSGFSCDKDNWKKVRFGDIFNIYNWINEQSEKRPKRLVRLMSQSQDSDEGRENNCTNYVLPNNGYILFGDHTCCVKKIVEPCKLLGDGVKLLQPTNNVSFSFLFALLQYRAKQIPQGYARHLSILREIECCIPKKKMQESIALIIESIDNQISTTKLLLSKYESIKKATVNLLLKPKEGWQEIQIGNVCQEVHERVSCSELTINTYISTENLVPERQGIVPASSVPIGINAIRFQRNDILVSNIRPYLKKIWYADFWGGCSNDVIVYRANEKVNPRFLFHLLSQDAFFNFAMDNATGTKMPRGDRKLLQLFAISIPSSLSEQEQISISIDKLSLILDNIYKSIKKLEKHKHSLLQYFFN